MSSNFGWTPASKVGIIPLRPLDFGEVIGKSFSALRHNPRVLLGFAIGTTVITSLITTSVIVWLTFTQMERLASYSGQNIATSEFADIAMGSIALIGAVGIALGALSTVIATVVQGIVAAEVGGAVVAERQTLSELFARIKGSVWRLLGFSALVGASIVVLTIAFILLANLLVPVVGLVVLMAIAMVPLGIWIVVKLAYVPAIIVLEHGRVFASIARSWSLSKRAFWRIFGVIVLIGLIFGFAGQAAGMVFGWFSNQLVPVLAPTGDSTIDLFSTLIMASIIPTAVTSVISAIGTVVAATGITISYIDRRMVTEGLGIDLQNHIENRDAGRAVSANPYYFDPNAQHIPGGYAQPGYAQAGYAQPGYGAPYPPPGFGTPNSQGSAFHQGGFQDSGIYPSTPGYQAPGAYQAPGDFVAPGQNEQPSPLTPPPAAPGYNAPAPFFPVADNNQDKQN